MIKHHYLTVAWLGGGGVALLVLWLVGFVW